MKKIISFTFVLIIVVSLETAFAYEDFTPCKIRTVEKGHVVYKAPNYVNEADLSNIVKEQYPLSLKIIHVNREEKELGGKEGHFVLESPNGKQALIVAYSNGFDARLVIIDPTTRNRIWEDTDKVVGREGLVEIRDINKDGKKEIIARWSVGMRPADNVWIYTWENSGNSAKLISPIERPGLSLFSGNVEIEDLDGDGIDEVIVGHEIGNPEGGPIPTGHEEIIYKWDGKEYKEFSRKKTE